MEERGRKEEEKEGERKWKKEQDRRKRKKEEGRRKKEKELVIRQFLRNCNTLARIKEKTYGKT